jgi:hypothetical protein
MIDPLTALAGATGGGVVTGLAKAGLQMLFKHLRQSGERQERIVAIARGDDPEIMQKRLEVAQTKPVRYETIKEQTRLKWFLWGESFDCKTVKIKDKLSQLPRERFQDFAIYTLIIFFCLCTGAYMWEFQEVVKSIDPKPGNKFSLLGLLNFEWGKNKELIFTGGGAALYLLSPVAYCFVHHLTGKLNK